MTKAKEKSEEKAPARKVRTPQFNGVPRFSLLKTPEERLRALDSVVDHLEDTHEKVTQLHEHVRSGLISESTYRSEVDRTPGNRVFDCDMVLNDFLRNATAEELEDDEVQQNLVALTLAATGRRVEEAVTQKVLEERRQQELGGQLRINVAANDPDLAQAATEYVARALYQVIGDRTDIDVYQGDASMKEPSDSLEAASKRLVDAADNKPLGYVSVVGDFGESVEAKPMFWGGYDGKRYVAEASAGASPEKLASVALVPTMVAASSFFE